MRRSASTRLWIPLFSGSSGYTACPIAFATILEIEMADDLKQRGGQDRTRINVSQDFELRDWADRFGVSKEVLKEAVQAVGDRADDVEKHLRAGRKPPPRNDQR
jgi:hypothetical protein